MYRWAAIGYIGYSADGLRVGRGHFLLRSLLSWLVIGDGPETIEVALDPDAVVVDAAIHLHLLEAMASEQRGELPVGWQLGDGVALSPVPGAERVGNIAIGIRQPGVSTALPASSQLAITSLSAR